MAEQKNFSWWLKTLAVGCGLLVVLFGLVTTFGTTVEHTKNTAIHEPVYVREQRIDKKVLPLAQALQEAREVGIRNEQRIIAIDTQLNDLKAGQAQILRELRNN